MFIELLLLLLLSIKSTTTTTMFENVVHTHKHDDCFYFVQNKKMRIHLYLLASLLFRLLSCFVEQQRKKPQKSIEKTTTKR